MGTYHERGEEGGGLGGRVRKARNGQNRGNGQIWSNPWKSRIWTLQDPRNTQIWTLQGSKLAKNQEKSPPGPSKPSKLAPPGPPRVEKGPIWPSKGQKRPYLALPRVRKGPNWPSKGQKRPFFASKGRGGGAVSKQYLISLKVKSRPPFSVCTPPRL